MPFLHQKNHFVWLTISMIGMMLTSAVSGELSENWTLELLEYASVTLSCVENSLGIDVPAFNQVLKDRFSCVIDGGYGKLKGKTFRISNMGDETDASIDALVGHLDAALEELERAKA